MFHFPAPTDVQALCLELIVYHFVKIVLKSTYCCRFGNNARAPRAVLPISQQRPKPCHVYDHRLKEPAMKDVLSIFNSLRRPRILIRAARIGAADYRRERDLKRLLRAGKLPKPGKTMPRLLAMEQDIEATRQAGHATYSITKHVEILAALVAEATFLSRKTTA
jgi:uncharacterized protein DUF6477